MELPTSASAELNNIYTILGFFLITGLGTFVSGLIFLIRKVVWIAQVEFRLTKAEADLNEAFRLLRKEGEKK